MKTKILAVLLLSITICSSCRKSTTNHGGSWTFEGVTYSATSCQNVTYGTLFATNASPSNINNLSFVTVTFPNAVLPATGGTYTVVGNTPPTGNQVKITLTTGGNNSDDYYSTGGNGNQTVSVSVSNSKVSVSGSGIEMSDLNTDSSTLIFNINQTQ